MKYSRLILVLMIFIAACSEEKELPVADVYQIQNLGTLATTEYTYGKILQLNDNKEWYKLGDRKILISVRAKVKAGVDLQKMKPEDVEVTDETTLILRLPAAQIVSFEMNPSEIKTEMSDVNGFRMEFSQTEKLKILKMGETSIRQDMMESNIIKDAEKNARVFLTDFYKELGFQTVIVEFKQDLK